MKCPVCDVTLTISSREGIEIDHCPQCRGVWLDRGELDKIIERAAPSVVGAGQGARAERRDGPDWNDRDRDRGRSYDRDYDRDDDRGYDRGRRRRRSFLDDIFDFD